MEDTIEDNKQCSVFKECLHVGARHLRATVCEAESDEAWDEEGEEAEERTTEDEELEHGFGEEGGAEEDGDGGACVEDDCVRGKGTASARDRY